MCDGVVTDAREALALRRLARVHVAVCAAQDQADDLARDPTAPPRVRDVARDVAGDLVRARIDYQEGISR